MKKKKKNKENDEREGREQEETRNNAKQLHVHDLVYYT